MVKVLGEEALAVDKRRPVTVGADHRPEVAALTADFVLGTLLGRSLARPVADALAAPPPLGLRMPLAAGFGDAKVSVCFPSSTTHPQRSGSVETATHRYFESFASRCIVVGRAPAELVDLFGYNPVVEADTRAQRSSLFASWSNHMANSVNCVPETRSSATSTTVAVVISFPKKIRETATTTPSTRPTRVISVPSA